VPWPDPMRIGLDPKGAKLRAALAHRDGNAGSMLPAGTSLNAAAQTAQPNPKARVVSGFGLPAAGGGTSNLGLCQWGL